MIETLFFVFVLAIFLAFAGHRTWMAYDRDSKVGKYLAGLFLIAWVPTVALMLNPNRLFAAPIILPISVVAITIVTSIVLRRVGPDKLELRSLIAAHQWRAGVGLLFLAGYVMNRIEPEFALKAGVGDIAVGLLSWGLLRSNKEITLARSKVLLWSAVAVLDLMFAVFLAVNKLLPWFESTGNVPSLGLLPFFGLPLFFATHGIILSQAFQNPLNTSMKSRA